MAALCGWATATATAGKGFQGIPEISSRGLSRPSGMSISISGRSARNSAAAASMSVRAQLVRVQEFLEEARELGKVHLYINTHTGQWKTRTPMEMFRYSDAEEDVSDACLVHDDGEKEMNMYIERVASAWFKQDKVLGVPYYIIQFVSVRGIAFSVTLMADPKSQEYEAKQLETYNSLLKKYGPEVKFVNQLSTN